MNKSSIKALLVILAVAILGATYLYVFKPKQDDTATLKSEADELETKYNELNAEKAHEAEYKAEIEQNNQAFDEVIAYYPADLNQETTTMLIKSMNKDKGVDKMDIKNASFSEDQVFYTLGGEDSSYECYVTSIPITYEGSYEGIKNLVDYVAGYKYRMNISSMSITYNAQEDTYAGAIALNEYAVSGGDRTPDTVDVDVPKGVSNPFVGGGTAPKSTSSSHDEGEGEDIVSNHDVAITLNNAANDTGDGIIVSAGAANVSSSDNKVVDVDLEIADGKAVFSIGSKELECDVDGNSFTIYVESSKRVDGDDKNGVKLNISNDTDVAVFIKVVDDDSDSPRFSVGSKSGTVKVY